MKKLYTHALAEKMVIDGVEERVFIASTDVIDRMGESVAQDGINLENYKKNPVILWSHNDREPNIGRAAKIGYKTLPNGKKALVYTPEFHRKSELSRLIADLVDGGFIVASSIGFMPLEREENVFTKSELYEISFVNVPANQEALSLAKSKGYGEETIKSVFSGMVSKELDVNAEAPIAAPSEDITEEGEQKNVIAYRKFPLAEIDAEWDGKAEVATATAADLKKMAAWGDLTNLNDKSAYKLAHHSASGYRTVFRGVVDAMATLMGAHGGIDLSEADRRGVYNHLARHYKEFGMEAPEYKTADEIVVKYAENAPLDEMVMRLQKTINGFIEEQRELQEKREATAKEAGEAFVKSVEERFEAMDLNLQGLQEGIKPGDDGLEQRFLDIEQNILTLAKSMREVASAMTEKGRKDEPAAKKADESLRHAQKALNIVTEAMNKALKNKFGE